MDSCKLVHFYAPSVMRYPQNRRSHTRYSLPVTSEESSMQSEDPATDVEEEIVSTEELLAQPLSSEQVNVDIKFIMSQNLS